MKLWFDMLWMPINSYPWHHRLDCILFIGGLSRLLFIYISKFFILIWFYIYYWHWFVEPQNWRTWSGWPFWISRWIYWVSSFLLSHVIVYTHSLLVSCENKCVYFTTCLSLCSLHLMTSKSNVVDRIAKRSLFLTKTESNF